MGKFLVILPKKNWSMWNFFAVVILQKKLCQGETKFRNKILVKVKTNYSIWTVYMQTVCKL